MSKYKIIKVHWCDTECTDFAILPCKRLQGERAAYCAYEHPFRFLDHRNGTAFPDFCPLVDGVTDEES